MNETIEAPRASIPTLKRLRQMGHPHCLACTHPTLKLSFTLEGPDALRASIDFTDEMTSFNGKVHGGLQALLIDEAFACALMSKGVYGATVDLNLRYKRSARVGPTAHIHVQIVSRYRTLYTLKAELRQEGKLCASATARFMEQTLQS